VRRRVATIAINVVIFVVLGETVSLAVYYAQNGGLFYFHRKTYHPIPETKDRRLTADALHPYFGPSHRPGHPFSMPPALQAQASPPAVTNNFGFVSPHPYPYRRKRDDEFVIGVFGGSVGVWFCQLGAGRLAANLKQHDAFKARELTPLCFSHEGYKQPQQALVLAYFLSIGQEFDLVVNIDGFNEVALGRLNDRQGLDVSMPSVMHIDPLINLVNESTLTPDKLEALARISRYKRQLNALADRINGNRIASVNLVLEQYFRIVSNRHVAALYAFATLPSNPSDSSIVYVTPKTKDRRDAELYDDIARNWATASTLMNDLLSAKSVPYVHVLQPNQYHTRRRFSTEEARVALNDMSPFRDGVQKGYPILIRMSESGVWQKNRVRFLDATRILDREPSPVYMDDCCHYTRRGNEILADYIADGILASDWLRSRTDKGREAQGARADSGIGPTSAHTLFLRQP
jgi:hypothetical protein